MTDFRNASSRTTISRSTWQKLNDRKVIHWAVGYAAAAWILLQIASFLGDTFDWPKSMLRGLTYLLASGIFPALVLAWFHGGKGKQPLAGTEVVALGAYLLVVTIAGLQFLNRSESDLRLYDLNSFELDVSSVDPPIGTIITPAHFDPALEVAVAVEYTFDPPLSDLPLIEDLTLDLGVIYDESPTTFRMMQHDSKSVRSYPLQATLRGRIDRGMIRSNKLKLHISAQLHKRDRSARTVGAPVRIEYEFRESIEE